MATEDDGDGGEREALQLLVTSAGWPVFLRLVEDDWGAEQTLAKINAALSAVSRGDHDAATDTVQQIQTARREVYRILEKPKERIAQLTVRQKSGRPFDALRRIGR